MINIGDTDCTPGGWAYVVSKTPNLARISGVSV